MREVLLAGFSQATDLAEYVMQTCEVDYRTAYLVVGRAAGDAGRRGLRGVDLTGALLDQAATALLGHPLGLAGRDLHEILDPEAIVRTRLAPGGAAPAIVRDMAAGCQRAAEQLRAAAERAQAAFHQAEDDLLTQAREVARG
jgi:argininosuccinate lyase